MAGVSVRDVPADAFVKEYAAFLKRQGRIETPQWVDFVKTGTHKQLPPSDPDWYYIRVASIARHIYLRSRVGVGRLNKRYGGSINRGSRPSHHRDASGSISRSCVQRLEKLGILEKDQRGGRRITQEGQRALDHIAYNVAKEGQEDTA